MLGLKLNYIGEMGPRSSCNVLGISLIHGLIHLQDQHMKVHHISDPILTVPIHHILQANDDSIICISCKEE